METARKKKVSIYTIGKALGVSPSTVSRALSNHPSVSSGVRIKVQKMAKDYNFKPRQVSNRVPNLCALVQQYDGAALDFDPFLSKVLEGMALYCEHEDLEISLFSQHVSRLNDSDLVRQFGRRNVDGVLVIRGNKLTKYLPQLDAHNFPYLCLLNGDGKHSGKVLSINEKRLAYEAINYLISLGHRDIGVLVNSLYTRSSELRLEGYRQALLEHGLEPRDQHIVSVEPDESGEEFGRNGMHRLWSQSPEITAVFTTSQKTAIGALFYIRETNIKIPERISLLAFDDYPEAAYTWPPLTAVRVPYLEVGYEGAKCLHRLVRGLPMLITDETREKIKGKIIVRESTGPMVGSV